MAASVEYMLCGLPIVSTPNTGGRNVFFDNRHAVIVEPTPEAVAAGVRQMISRKIPRHEVREAVLEKMRDHRRRFVQLIDDILESFGHPRTFAKEFPKLFVNKLRVSASFPDGLLVHAGKGMPVELCRQLAGMANQ